VNVFVAKFLRKEVILRRQYSHLTSKYSASTLVKMSILKYPGFAKGLKVGPIPQFD